MRRWAVWVATAVAICATGPRAYADVPSSDETGGLTTIVRYAIGRMEAFAQSPPIKIVALGDSIPSGFGSDDGGYVEDVGTLLTGQRAGGAAVYNEAMAGDTTADLLHVVADPYVVKELQQADVVIVQIGANDFDLDQAIEQRCLDEDCYAGTRALMAERVGTALEKIHRITPQARLVLVGYWSVFFDGEAGRELGETYVQVADKATREVNDALKKVAAGRNATFVDLYQPFKMTYAGDVGQLLIQDGMHPNAEGHWLIAEQVVAALNANGV